MLHGCLTKGYTMTKGSASMANNAPAKEDDVIVARFRSLGALLVSCLGRALVSVTCWVCCMVLQNDPFETGSRPRLFFIGNQYNCLSLAQRARLQLHLN